MEVLGIRLSTPTETVSGHGEWRGGNSSIQLLGPVGGDPTALLGDLTMERSGSGYSLVQRWCGSDEVLSTAVFSRVSESAFVEDIGRGCSDG